MVWVLKAVSVNGFIGKKDSYGRDKEDIMEETRTRHGTQLEISQYLLQK